jgi:hypothetical protein
MRLLAAVIIALFFAPSLLFAQTLPIVVIHEIAWMGTTASANDEWIELKNTTDQSISLAGWTLTNGDGKITAKLKGQIPAGGFYILERTDDTSVPETKADAIYRGSLRNSGDILELRNANHALIDSAAFSSGWPKGSNTTKQTMEKIGDTWQTSQGANGTPKAENSIAPALKKANGFDNSIISKNTSASIAETKNPWMLFLVALAASIALGGIILFIKLKIIKSSREVGS